MRVAPAATTSCAGFWIMTDKRDRDTTRLRKKNLSNLKEAAQRWQLWPVRALRFTAAHKPSLHIPSPCVCVRKDIFRKRADQQ